MQSRLFMPIFYILPLNFLFFKSVCCLMHHIRNRKVPNNILNLFSDITICNCGTEWSTIQGVINRASNIKIERSRSVRPI